jgi:hypothetical protein
MDLAGTVLDTLAVGGDVAHFCLFRNTRAPQLQVALAGGSLHFQWDEAGWERWILWRRPFGTGAATVEAVCDTPAYSLPLAGAGPMARFFVTGTDAADPGIRP